MRNYQIGFVLEQALGHVTHTKNLQTNVPFDSEVTPHWGLVPWESSGLSARIPIYKSNWTVRAGLRARRILTRIQRRQPLDALFFHTQVPAILAADWVRRIPSVISLDATPLQYDSLGQFYQHENGPAWLEQLKWRLNRDCYHAARHLVTWSQWARQGLIDGYAVPADKVTVIPPGVNTADWQCPAPRRLHDGPVKILFVGANLERKGGLLLLEAFRALKPLNVELHLVTHDKLPAEAGLYLYHAMKPNSPELKALYHECDLFCLPTSGDCLPMVLSEAAAAGLPTISTRVAGIPEIVRNDETGLLVPTNDKSALTTALLTLVERPELRLRMGERAVQYVTRQFDARTNALRLLDLLKYAVDTAQLHTQMA